MEKIGRGIIDSALRVHKALGPGLLERIYEVCFCHELSKKGIENVKQIDVPIQYDGLTFEEGLRLDVLVAGQRICELKAVDQVQCVWEAQILSHLKLLDKRLGYLINFNVKTLAKA